MLRQGETNPPHHDFSARNSGRRLLENAISEEFSTSRLTRGKNQKAVDKNSYWLTFVRASIVVLLCVHSVQAFSSSTTTGAWRNPRNARPLAFVPRKRYDYRPSILSIEFPDKKVTNPLSRSLFRLSLSQSPDEEDDDEDDDDDDDTNEGRMRKRDRIKDWFSQGSGDDGRPRMKTRFDNLFSGMPGIGDILADKQDDDASSMGSGEFPRRQKKDPVWFEEEKNRIMESFEQILQETMAKLEQQRKEDPESVPENAEGIIKSVLKQEMDTEIELAKEELSLQRLQEYESNQRRNVDEMNISGPIDDEVQRLIDESEEEYSRMEASRLELEEFLKYEAEAFSQAASQTETETELANPEGDLDTWALERLQEMAKSRQDVDGGEVVLDILDEITEDLQNRMEKEKLKKGSVKTETLKEWQMYRAIATRLGRQRESMTGDELAAAADTDDEEIVRRLGLWKEYVSKEQRFRDEGGLSQTAKKGVDEGNPPPHSDRQSRAETRKKINRMSIEALESLMVNSDPARRQKLQDEISFLKAQLEGKDYLDFEEPEEDELVGPVDMSGVFSSGEPGKSKPRPAEQRRRQQENNSPVEVPASSDFESSGDNDFSQVLSPDTPFFSESDESSSQSVPPPNTAFFSDSEDSEEEYVSPSPKDSKLGSLEEQKLASLYRRAGARTREEQDRVRSGWEEYQRVEKEKRKLSGLDDSAEMDNEYASSKFNISEVMKDDGDFDAEKVLSAIGPRPKRGAKRVFTNTVPLETSPGREPSEKTLGKEEIASSLYRSVSAVGGDRFKDDPEAKARDQAEFQSFLEKEIELRGSLDESSESASNESPKIEDFNDEDYAEDVLSSIGPRPKPRRSRQVDPREYSDMGGVLSQEDSEDEDDDDTEEEGQETSDTSLRGANVDGPQMPDWLKRENEEARNPRKKRKTFLGEEVEDAFDDDKYEKNMRQLAEYERRRAGKQASLGIDISDVLGRRNIDDYKDYKFDEDMYGGGSTRRGWGVASFADRKRNLVEYTELDLSEVNALMDHRDSVHSTGVSQYTKRINRPFEAFGAIFRVEGVFADLSGLHERAWTEVAEKEGLRLPDQEEVRRASVVHPEAAVREGFVWTDDFLEAARLAKVFRETFNTIFDDWAEEKDLIDKNKEAAPVEKGSLAIGEDLLDVPATKSSVKLPKNEGELLELLLRAWTQVAFDKTKSVPTEAQIQQAAMVTPDIAIQEVFGWTTDRKEADMLEKTFQAVLRKLSGNGPIEEETPHRPKARTSRKEESDTGFISEAALMEAHYAAWTKVAEQFGFEKPTPDEVLGAFVLNDPTIAVRDGFGWTADKDVLSQVVQQFSSELNQVVRGRAGSITATVAEEEPPQNSPPQKMESHPHGQEISSSAPGSPSFEEILEMHQKAWGAAAASHGFNAPPDDFVKLSLNLDSEDVITRIFRWTWEGDVVRRIAATFREKLKIESEAFAAKHELELTKAAKGETTQEPETGGESEETISDDELYQAAFTAWTETAEVHNLPLPTREQVIFAMSVGPDEAIARGFEWTTDREASWWIMETYKEKIRAERERLNLDELEGSGQEDKPEEKPLVSIIPGGYQWIKSLREYEMQCGVVSHLSKDQVAALLKFAKLDELFEPEVRVSANNGYKSDSQQLLGAALRLERRPDHCVVFDSSPYASVAAHELDMRSVGLIGSYPRYELLTADTTASGFQELTAFNIRRLFGERIFDQPELDRQQADPSYQKKVRTKFDWGDD